MVYYNIVSLEGPPDCLNEPALPSPPPSQMTNELTNICPLDLSNQNNRFFQNPPSKTY